MRLPRATRAAIRRMHHSIGHKANSVLIHLLKGARADKQLIHAVGKFRCEECAETEEAKRLSPVGMPTTYAFNFDLILDILETKDFVGDRFSFLSMVCNGTTFHIVCLVAVGGSQASSEKCLKKLLWKMERLLASGTWR